MPVGHSRVHHSFCLIHRSADCDAIALLLSLIAVNLDGLASLATNHDCFYGIHIFAQVVILHDRCGDRVIRALRIDNISSEGALVFISDDLPIFLIVNLGFIGRLVG